MGRDKKEIDDDVVDTMRRKHIGWNDIAAILMCTVTRFSIGAKCTIQT